MCEERYEERRRIAGKCLSRGGKDEACLSDIVFALFVGVEDAFLLKSETVMSIKVFFLDASRSSANVHGSDDGCKPSARICSPSAWNRARLLTSRRPKSQVAISDFLDIISSDAAGQMNLGQSFSHRLRKVLMDVEEVAATRES